jgi:uncharacterized protein YjbI with pentapeptide repeats
MVDKKHLEILMQGVEVWNEWRDNNPYIDPDLSYAELKGANLDDVNFYGVNLSGANLFKATLIHAGVSLVNFSHANLGEVNLNNANVYGSNLSSANLCNAHLQSATLSRANLFNANVTNANFIYAKLILSYLRETNFNNSNLFQADLSDAVFDKTDFTHAKLGWTVFTDNNLSSVKGLDTVHHLGPSTIDIDTIYLSNGNIPEIFLRGAGVPEDFITYMRSLTVSAQPIQFYSCFISYSHADKLFARRLHDALQGRGIRCWLDEHELLPGQKIYTEVDRGIRLWDKVLLCCSKDSLKSWWVENEIQIAFDKEQGLRKERDGAEVLALIPLNLDGYLFSDEWKSGLRTEIKSRLAADFTGWETDNSRFETEFERLIKALRADAGGREQPPQSRL